ncbi:hypothetical protein VOLCADRAFT_108456 [Volvox carteri f. nagariensis]|uniref:RCC1-like domain-containing protein n=1 Tax=Volvox carteri f. nagariensis TaxID=3068 RepID=D8UK87_VOLCA|nr:uncharacterized protein VOLCADRAFT_108456 [Volvox carteri f. nagariensis]EFJ39861.1 hypothetical protein VOLCADRAFT_108456 [Volvox carteri f. nagariensis]|eukprot:XP_002959067.1 hypothetical protein VOLCADRAFT_108456 [Volvox carteri f. nagariensis]
MSYPSFSGVGGGVVSIPPAAVTTTTTITATAAVTTTTGDALVLPRGGGGGGGGGPLAPLPPGTSQSTTNHHNHHYQWTRVDLQGAPPPPPPNSVSQLTDWQLPLPLNSALYTAYPSPPLLPPAPPPPPPELAWRPYQIFQQQQQLGHKSAVPAAAQDQQQQHHVYGSTAAGVDLAAAAERGSVPYGHQSTGGPMAMVSSYGVMSPSESSGSLAQYGMGSGGGGGGGAMMMGGPGSLCASLPYYVRRPPIEAVVFGWGVSEDGQLGVEERENVVAPKVVEALLGVQISGRSFCRTPLVAGSRNTMALDAAGQVWSFGWNDRGTLGHGHRDVETKPKRIPALKGIRIVQVAIGGWHCLALSDRGTMFAWGGNEYGQCGSVLPGQRDITEPMPVDLGLGPSQRVRQVSAGGMHSLALLEDGMVWQWGENWGDFSMRPVRTPRPVAVHPDEGGVAAVSCGAFHNLALTAQGRVLSWGMNDYGQLGNGSTTYATTPRPVLDMEGVVVADIAAGGWHSCALSSAGEVWVWGRGEYGRLGLGDRSGSSKLRPQKVRGLESHVVVQGRWVMAEGQEERGGGRHSICLAIPVRDTAASGGLASGEYDGEYDGMMPPFRRTNAVASAASANAIAAAAAAAGGMMGTTGMPLQRLESGPVGFGSVLPHSLQSLHLSYNRTAIVESDNLDGFSEPSLYDRYVVMVIYTAFHGYVRLVRLYRLLFGCGLWSALPEWPSPGVSSGGGGGVTRSADSGSVLAPPPTPTDPLPAAPQSPLPPSGSRAASVTSSTAAGGSSSGAAPPSPPPSVASGSRASSVAAAAAAAAEAAEEFNDGSGTGEEDLCANLDAQEDDTDEDLVYDNSGVVQHPRSPSLMSRPRSPPLPLSPRRPGSFNTHGGSGGGGGSRSGSPALMGVGSAGGGGGNLSGGGISGSPSSRALLSSSYGSPRLPSAMPP